MPSDPLARSDADPGNGDTPQSALRRRVDVDHRRLRELLVEASRPTPTPGTRRDSVHAARSAIDQHLRTVQLVLESVADADFGRVNDTLRNTAETLAASYDGEHERGLHETAAALEAHIEAEDDLISGLERSVDGPAISGLARDYGNRSDQIAGL